MSNTRLRSKLSVVERDINAIIEFLERAPHPVYTPRDISSVTQIPYRRVTRALFCVNQIQCRNYGKITRALRFDGTQFQSFVFHNNWVPPKARQS